MTLTIYGNPKSRTIRPMWFCEEVGLDYELKTEHPHGDVISGLNPLKQVPVLVDGDTVITDSVTILHWLADREGKLTYPHTTPERARLESRINFVLGDMEAPLWLWFRRRMFARARGEPEPSQQLFDELRRDFAAAEERFVRLIGAMEFLAGDTFTIADIVAGHVGDWGKRTGFEPQTPEFGAYVERVAGRPALAAARAL